MQNKQEDTDSNINRSANNAIRNIGNPEDVKEPAGFAVVMNGSRRSLLPTTEMLQQKADERMPCLKKEYSLL